MRKRIPNTEIYLDTSDFYFTSTPNETEIEMSDRFIVSEDRDGSPKEQTISGTLSITDNLNVTNKLTCGSFEITESELTVKHLFVSSNSSDDIWLKVSGFGKLYTPTIYSVFAQDTNEDAYAKINLQKYSSSDPSKIEFVIPRRDSSSYKTSTYTMTKDGFYCDDSNNASTSLGTSSYHWSKAYIDTGNIQTLQPINTSNTNEIKDFSSIQGVLLKGTTIEGTVSSLYNITKVQDSPHSYHCKCDPGALFIANNYSPSSGCMTIRLDAWIDNPYDTLLTIQHWNKTLAGKRIRIKRGAIHGNSVNIDVIRRDESDNTWYVDTNVKITKNPDNHFGYKISFWDNQEPQVQIDIGYITFNIAYIRSNPLLYNSEAANVSAHPINDDNWCHDEAINICKDYQEWDNIAFFEEILFEIPNINTLWYKFSEGEEVTLMFKWVSTQEDPKPQDKNYAEIESADFAYPRSIMVMRVS